MSLELNLRFPDPGGLVIKFEENESERLDFQVPLTAKDQANIRWYLEVYSAQYTADVDDARARRIEDDLPKWGAALFEAAFSSRAAQRLFNDFQDCDELGRLITISARHPEILGLPWELLRDPAGTYLVHDNPRISVRRRLAGAGGGRRPFKFRPKDTVRVLFVISRPSDVGFIDPRGEAQAVMRAIAHEAAGRVAVEFLRPATLDALVARLEDGRLPAVDILHFDGHGVYDADGRHWEDARVSDRMFTKDGPAAAADTGYLLFEEADGTKALISADTLGDMLNRQKVGLIVLSACQSAMVKGRKSAADGNDETAETDTEAAMGSVAARLTHAGIPAVLAMTYSVLVATTQQLFGQFYQYLARGQGMGEALDNARRNLYLHQERGERQRGQTRVTLKLQDWFLPALYQSGSDTPLLKAQSDALPNALPDAAPDVSADLSANRSADVLTTERFGNLPELKESGFWGRSRELWAIERAFVTGTRRLSVVGFGGQGKTFLVQEAGRWLCETGMFQRVCFVDYASFQGTDAVGLAVSTLGTVLDRSLVDVAAATAALGQNSTLLILDNLEVLGADALRALLDVAEGWSKIGAQADAQRGCCRVLLTSRQPDFDHAGYKTAGSREHICLTLGGLGSEGYPDDALNYFQALMKLSPAPTVPAPDRAALVNLFDMVDFHPLSIGLLAQQLKDRRPAELGQRLERFLAETDETDKDKCLVASLKLSLERVGPEVRQWLPRLGVFQGGAFEDDLLAITGLGLTEQQARARQWKRAIEKLQRGEAVSEAESGLPTEEYQQLLQLAQENPDALTELLAGLGDVEITAGADEGTWPTLRQALVASGLLQPEQVPGVGVPFLKFHPTLAPVLWPQLSAAEQADLLARHRQRYYQLSGQMYREDSKNPLFARAIVRRELPNLLMAVNGALAAGDADAAEFVAKVSKFLGNFGLKQDQQVLTDKLAQVVGEVGSRGWYLARSNQGEALYGAGGHVEAVAVFEEILAGLGAAHDSEPSYERCTTLSRLGRCFRAQGQAGQAERHYRRGLAVAAQLEQSEGVKRQRGVLHTELADVLRAVGDFAGAKASYEAALEIDEELGDSRGAAVDQGQLGTLAMVQGELSEAATRHQAALQTFQQLGEPAAEATAWHQLGMVYQEARQWDEAERHYRESARIEEARGNLAAAAQTWNQLALVNKGAGRVAAAIAWYEKAIEGGKSAGDWLPTARALNNLANLLQSQQNAAGQYPHLDTARQHAEESLAIKQTLDPAAAEIWTTYYILAVIAEKQDDAAAARGYRQQSRQAKAAFAGTQYELRRHGPLIAAVVAAVSGNEEVKAQLLAEMGEPAQSGESKLVSAIRRILEGDQDEADIVDPLDYDDSMIVMAIFEGIADPSYLETLRVI